MKDLRAFYKKKRILVTGGAGFIGSHLAQTLASYNAHVTVLDDFSTGCISNLSPFLSNISLIASDITSFKTCLKATKKQDIVFHLAAMTSVPESVNSPALCEKINSEGTSNLLEACKKNNVGTFLFSSSSAVYGERDDVCCEDDRPNPKSPYAKSKLAGEKLCIEYAQKHAMRTACLRYFNVYGSRQNPNGAYAGVVAKFKHNLANNKPIIIYGDGTQTRDFVHVSRVVQANLFVATLPTLQGDVFNIASGRSITLLELLEQLERETNKKRADLLFEPARSGDILSSQASCKKYQKLTRTAASVN